MRRLPATLTVLLTTMSMAGCANNSAWTFSPDGGRAPITQTAAPTRPVAAASLVATAVPGAGGPVTGNIMVEAFDLGFTPSAIEVAAAGTYNVTLNNTGQIAHDITFASGQTIHAEPGEAASGAVDIPSAGLDFICSIPGHVDAGMKGAVRVASTAQGSPLPTASHSPDDHGGPPPTTDVQPDPNAPPPARLDPVAPARLDGEVHDIDLVMTEQDMTVAEGFVQHVWTFGGQVPGPVIRVKVGDTIRVHLINPPENEMSHSIDFHASQVAWNDEMRSIAPGEELLYEWTADYAGVWMYHCGTAPALHHIANGMYGMVIVEPAEGLPPVDSEFAIVQSEWYLGPQGQPVSLGKASAAAPAPDYVVFNGVANQYAAEPIQVDTGGTVRIFVLNAGPNVDSSFHIVGTIFNTVIKEGVQLLPGNVGNWGSQAVDLAPAQGAIVEFTTAEDGQYPMVSHAFNFVGRGALGIIQAGDGDPTN
jgi:nitrite reductase (NO-forming)